MNYIGLWLDPAEDEANIAWVRAASDAIAPYGTGARYVNFLADEGEAGVASAYEAETFTRLANLKATLRPDELLPPQPEHQARIATAQATRHA